MGLPKLMKKVFKNMLVKNTFLATAVAISLFACKAGGDRQGVEYAPNMYHSVAYEPLTQITDESAGTWVNSLDNGRGEYFNSNKYNPFRMNMRMPPPNTVKRNSNVDPFNWLPYRSKKVSKDSIDLVTTGLVNPYDSTANIVADGKLAYEIYCGHCHGSKGKGDGPVAVVAPLLAVANLTSDNLLNISEGHIFHVITYGAGLMGAHGSQVSQSDRWKIAKYIKTLQLAKKMEKMN